MEITIRRKRLKISKKRVENVLKNKEPELKSSYKYFIEVNDKYFPVKQAIGETLSISPMEFGTMQAYQILQNLGFVIKKNRKWIQLFIKVFTYIY